MVSGTVHEVRRLPGGSMHITEGECNLPTESRCMLAEGAYTKGTPSITCRDKRGSAAAARDSFGTLARLRLIAYDSRR